MVAMETQTYTPPSPAKPTGLMGRRIAAWLIDWVPMWLIAVAVYATATTRFPVGSNTGASNWCDLVNDSASSEFCVAVNDEVWVTDGSDLLLANESLDVARLGALADQALITVAVDSDITLDAAIAGGVRSVLIDVEIGLPRCGCSVDDAPRLAERARAAGLDVRGVMGYEGHLMMVTDRSKRIDKVAAATALLLEAADRVGGDIVSGGGTGTFDTNTWCTEIQAGSYTLMDTQYLQLDLPFDLALSVLATVISVNSKGWIVANAGLKALAMDHGDPSWDGGKVLFCSDEHTTLAPDELTDWSVGDLVRLQPAHVDPTVAKHDQMWLVDGDEVIDEWAVDLRGW